MLLFMFNTCSTHVQHMSPLLLSTSTVCGRSYVPYHKSPEFAEPCLPISSIRTHPCASETLNHMVSGIYFLNGIGHYTKSARTVNDYGLGIRSRSAVPISVYPQSCIRSPWLDMRLAVMKGTYGSLKPRHRPSRLCIAPGAFRALLRHDASFHAPS